MTNLGVRAIAASVASGRRTAQEVVEEAIAAALAHENLGAMWFLDEAGARAAARAIDGRLAAGEDSGPLIGVPVVVKDAFHVRGMPGGSGATRVIAHRDALVVRRLRDAGAIVIGKAAMHQLGWGMTGQTPGRPLTRNPHDLARQPGGSSSGSAVAVAVGIVPLALGGDTGGSVRQPAAWCDVVGWKPMQAAIPRRGLDPLSPTLDTIGWFTRDVEDAVFVHCVLTGHPIELAPGLPRDCSIGIDDEVLNRADPVVAAAVRAAILRLERLGAERRQLTMPGLPARLGPIYAADLAACWGKAAEAEPSLFGRDVLDGIAAGQATSAVDYILCHADCEAARRRPWSDATVIVGPTCPVLPPELTAPDDVRRVGALTRPYNLLDWPAISVPAPGVPGVGIQIAAPRPCMTHLLQVAKAFESTREDSV